MNEFALIERLRRQTVNDPRVLLGIGDDTAVLRYTGNKDLLLTTDMLIEGRHFRSTDASPYRIGRKALAVNISDIAAMGGLPTHAVVAVGLPRRRAGAFALALHQGLRDLAKKFRVNLVGGDTNRADRVIVSVALLGEVEKGRAVTRSGAQIGDRVFVTGVLGGSYRSGKHLDFMPRVREARFLVKNFHVHAMIDVSDGLASDARRIAEESRVGLRLEEALIPVSKSAFGLQSALTDGEDFELLFTVPEKEASRLEKHFYAVGQVVAKSEGVTLMKKNGRRSPLRGGYDHFR